MQAYATSTTNHLEYKLNSYHIWIVNMKLFQPPTTTRMTRSSVAVKQIALYTKVIALASNPPEDWSDYFILHFYQSNEPTCHIP